MTIDWKVLFWKYAEHVGNEEGVDFLTYQGKYTLVDDELVFEKWCTDEEWAAIEKGPDE